jgi:hypothetical protein
MKASRHLLPCQKARGFTVISTAGSRRAMDAVATFVADQC